jgi:glucose-6-phosphate-specific signal transduction histidine kinase
MISKAGKPFADIIGAMLENQVSPRRKALLMAAAVLVYVAGLALLNLHFGMGRGFIALVPITAAAWLYGMRGGVISSLMAVPVNRGLLTLLGDPIAETITPKILILSGISALAVGCALGYMRHLILHHQETAQRLEQTNKDLQEAMDNIKTLSGLIPICAHCKSIRDDEGFWQQLEFYLHERTELEFTHGICPSCVEKHYPEE